MPGVVDEALFAPHICSVTGLPDSPLFDTGTNMPTLRGRVYIGAKGAEIVSKALGYPTLIEWAQTKDDLSEALKELQELRDENKELGHAIDAIDLLESRGFTNRKKMGRPKKIEA